MQSALAASAGKVSTIPTWSSSFSVNGTSYPYTMVGTNPTAGSATTKVPTEIIPLKLTFSTGVTLDGTQKVASTKSSPLFQKAQFISGKTQYGDAMQRAEFWNSVSTTSPKYHVLLGQPKVLKAATITVPAQSGQVITGKNTGAQIGEIDINWFDAQLQNLITSRHISAKTLPIFLSYNTFLYDTTPSNCCILGYHNAVQTATAIQTYIYSAYSDPGIFGTTPIEDVHALSHEVAEWLNDPFTNNAAPNWSVPSEPQYGCNGDLEVGDPLVGIALTVNGYHPQDMTFFSWFARQAPSIGIHGQYTYLGTFTTFSPSC